MAKITAKTTNKVKTSYVFYFQIHGQPQEQREYVSTQDAVKYAKSHGYVKVQKYIKDEDRFLTVWTVSPVVEESPKVEETPKAEESAEEAQFQTFAESTVSLWTHGPVVWFLDYQAEQGCSTPVLIPASSMYRQKADGDAVFFNPDNKVHMDKFIALAYRLLRVASGLEDDNMDELNKQLWTIRNLYSIRVPKAEV